MDDSPTLDGTWHSPTLMQAILADSMRVPLVASGQWLTMETDRARKFTVEAVGLPWRGSWTVTIEPNGDHRAAIVEFLESNDKQCTHMIVQTPIENLGQEVTPDMVVLKCCGCSARWKLHELPGAIVADLQQYAGSQGLIVAIESDVNLVVERPDPNG